MSERFNELKPLLGLDKEKFSLIEDPTIIAETEKAFLFPFNEGERWCPKSQLRIDNEGDIYVASWIMDKIKEEVERRSNGNTEDSVPF